MDTAGAIINRAAQGGELRRRLGNDRLEWPERTEQTTLPRTQRWTRRAPRRQCCRVPHALLFGTSRGATCLLLPGLQLGWMVTLAENAPVTVSRGVRGAPLSFRMAPAASTDH